MKRPDLIVLIAVWEFLSAFGIFLVIGGIVSAFFFAIPGMWWWDSMWWAPNISVITILVMSVVLLVVLAYFIIALMGGVGLLKGKEWGRILGIVHAALSVFWVPIGTVIGILVLIYLTKPEVSDYFTR